ncbi:MAG: exodeoxyribonuclease VII small subunit [Rhodospirillales bacterium]|nr:exodeoxyribonuclease VII small subunit [Rhodospirillales bacterium]MDE0381933.1 exodeoxyribonuclease VII small subunit [Rhodospirillales bacterium]
MVENEDKDGEAQTFESAMRELEGIVHELEAGDTGLEAAIAAYERGVKLKKFCEDKLRQAELRVEKIDGDSEGAARTEPFETG